MSSKSLKNKTINGVSWSLLDNIANYGISFVVGLILARLLSPEEFGILGMITVFIAISNTIVDCGFSNALIRKSDVSERDYNTVFYFNFLIGLVLYISLYACTPLISQFFHEPQLTPVTRVMCLVLIVNSLSIIQRTILVKNIDFKIQTKVSLISSVLSGMIGIGMAFTGYGVWSLVMQQLSRQVLQTILLWTYSKWRPRLEYSQQSFNELFGFGSRLLLSGIIDTIYRNIYYLIIGRFYSTGQLGQYTRAEQFNTIFSSNLTAIVQRVSYPVLSSIQNEPERLKQAYQRVIKSTMLVSFACMLGLAAVARPLIQILIGEQWLPAANYLQIICFSGMLYPLHAINLNILQVVGRSDVFLKLEIIKKIIAVIPITLGFFYGIEFMLWGSVGTSLIAYFLNCHFSARYIDYSVWEQIKDIMPAFLTSGVMGLSMFSLLFLDFSNWIVFLLQCTVGLSIILLIYETKKLPEYLEMKGVLLSVSKRK